MTPPFGMDRATGVPLQGVFFGTIFPWRCHGLKVNCPLQGHARAGVNADGFGRLKVGRKNGHEGCSRTLYVFFFTEKRKRLGSKGVKKNRPQT